MTGCPPVATGGAHVSVTCESPPVADNNVGALDRAGGPAMLCSGTVATITVEGPLPTKVLGVTRNCTCVPDKAGFGAQRCSRDVVAFVNVFHETPLSELTSTL